MPTPPTDALAWIVIAVFAASAVTQHRAPRTARALAALGWAVFALFWLLLVPHFAFAQRSYVEGILTAVAVPACLYTGYLVWWRRPSLLVLSRAVAFAGVVYLPFMTLPWLEQLTVETVTRQAEFVIRTLGYAPTIEPGPNGYRSEFVFTAASGHRYTVPVLLACSGIGSISIVSGIVLASDAPLGRRLRALAVAVPVIYGLNMVRVVFIALAHGEQWLRVFEPQVMLAFGESDPRMVSYLLADRVISQGLSVVALVALTLWLLGRVPRLATVLEEATFVVTGREFDLRSRLTAP